MKLNKIPVRTTNNFKVNELDLDLDLKELNTDKLYEVEGLNIKQTIKNEKITTKVGLTFNKYLDLEININKVIEKPIILNYTFSSGEVLISKISFNYESSSKADFVIKYNSSDEGYGFNHLLEVLNASSNVNGSITYINLLNNNSTNIIAFEDKVEENSNITHNLIDIGGNTRIYNAHMESIGYESKNYFNNIYIGKNNDLIDINYDFKNIAKRSINNLKVEGCLKDKSKKTFRGTIDFLEGCTLSEGIENENCVLLSNEAISRSVPLLLCHEEDVVGAHGEATGKISEDKLFYLMSRGLSRNDAEKLIIMANFTSIINEIPEIMREEVLRKVENLI